MDKSASQSQPKLKLTKTENEFYAKMYEQYATTHRKSPEKVGSYQDPE